MNMSNKITETKSKPTILVDLDDTINEFGEEFWNLYNRLYEGNVSNSDVNCWDLQKFAREDINVYDLFKYPGLFRSLRVRDYAKTFLKNALKKYNVYIVTDSPKGTSHNSLGKNQGFSNPTDDKRAWVKENFPFFPQDQIIICSHKWMVNGDILLDDKPDTFIEFNKRGRKVILIDAPHNQDIETKWRAKSLKEAEIMIEKLLSVQSNLHNSSQ